MKVTLYAATLGFGLLATVPAQAQAVHAEVIIGSRPVSGRVIIGEPYYRDRVVHVYQRPVRRVVHRYPRIIVVERVHRGRGHYKHYRRDDYHRMRAWYDRDRRVYYDGYRYGLREVTLYEAGGRYYDYDYYSADYRDDWRDRDRDRDRDNRDDRDDRYDDD